ncbi:TPA: ParA family protein [Clostridioides difficile]|uniref:ParA family protein n=1 Tax=Clostridioides difficile TaxID=1496 RepID=UPI001C0DFD56|nr:ParA family protein [Clostridioides difficile]MDI2978204.1 ParA family protein [Clostridioides difficile]MDI6151146.1 ParA family protein [Clostridioides difficile]MDI7827597.1 ParA family protein [Clostridioides difficile]MDU8820126.1 ParA family protein [Clostridioides difficile]QWR63675.1 ParA family protein [Clostridioides difficile]
MVKICLAVASNDLEEYLVENTEYIQKEIGDDVEFVGEVVYREGVLQAIINNTPDVLIIREGLPGKVDILRLVQELTLLFPFPKLRIIFIAKDRRIGDALLASLVQFRVYDIVIGNNIDAFSIIEKIITPNILNDVAQFLPKIRETEKNTKLFEAQDLELIKKASEINQAVKKEIKPLKSIKNIEHHDKKVPKDYSEEKIILEREIENEIKEEDIVIEDELINIEKEEEIIIEDEGLNIEDYLIEEEIIIEEEIENKEELNIEEDIVIEDEGLNIEDDLIEEELITINENLIIDEDINKNEEELNIEEQIENKEELNIEKEIKDYLKEDKKQEKEIKIIKKNKPLRNKLPLTKSSEEKFTYVKKVNQQIISFLGAKQGVGNSQLSFNVAVDLANKGLKVLYIDLNERSSINDIFYLGFDEVGIDTALEGIDKNDYILINKSIVTINNLLNEYELLYKSYLKFPKTLEFLFFSQKYVEEKHEIPINKIKDLNIYLIMQKGYDFIIINATNDIHNELSELLLIYSAKIFFTIAQDASVIKNNLLQTKMMDEKGINFREKFYYLLNKYDNSNFNKDQIYEWMSDSLDLEGFPIITIPNLNREFINSNFNGLPLILDNKKNKEMKKSFLDIYNIIIK